jgi:hypothetical protein
VIRVVGSRRWIEEGGIVIVRTSHPRRDRPHHHEVRRERREQIVRVYFHAEPALISRFGEDERHTVMDLCDEVIRRHSDDGKCANPFPALRMMPVLPKPGDGEGRAAPRGLSPRAVNCKPWSDECMASSAARLTDGA